MGVYAVSTFESETFGLCLHLGHSDEEKWIQLNQNSLNVPVNNDEWELMSQIMRSHLLLGTSEADAARHS